MPTIRHSATARRQAAARQKRARQNRITLILAASLIVVGVGALLYLAWQQSQPTSSASPAAQAPVVLQNGAIAPDFQLASLSGDDVSLSDYRGSVVVVNMWATWCPPCRAEMPDIHRVYQRYADQGLVVLALNEQEDATIANAFITENELTFPVLLDINGDVAELYSVRSFPTTIVLDQNGRIQHVQVGAITEKQLDAIVQPLLQG